jgi:hypothetical protein
VYHTLTSTELRHLRYTLEVGFWDLLGYTELAHVPSRGDVTVAREINAEIGEVEQELARRGNREAPVPVLPGEVRPADRRSSGNGRAVHPAPSSPRGAFEGPSGRGGP